MWRLWLMHRFQSQTDGCRRHPPVGAVGYADVFMHKNIYCVSVPMILHPLQLLFFKYN